MNCGKDYAAVVQQCMLLQNFITGGVMKFAGGIPAKVILGKYL